MSKKSKQDKHDAVIRGLAKKMIDVADGQCRPDQGAMAAMVACIGMAYEAGIPRDVFMHTAGKLFDQAGG